MAGDMRRLFGNGSAGDFVKFRLANAAVRRILPPSDHTAFHTLALNGPQTPFKRQGGYIV